MRRCIIGLGLLQGGSGGKRGMAGHLCFTIRGFAAIHAADHAKGNPRAMTDTGEINALLQAVAQRDTAAFRTLYERTCGYLMAVVLRICRDRQIAEDLLQDVYVQVWRRAETYDPAQGAGMGWLTVIARNRAIDHVRTQGRMQGHQAHDMQAEIDRLPSLTPDVAHMSDLRHLWGCLGRLPVEQRQAILLAYYDGWSREELARHFEIPENTLKTWLRRSLTALRSCMEGD